MAVFPDIPSDWAPEIAGSIVGGVFSALVALLVVFLSRAGDRRRFETENRAKKVEEVQHSLARFLLTWINSDDYSVSTWYDRFRPACLSLYIELVTAAPGIKDAGLENLIDESQGRFLKPTLDTAKSMIKELEDPGTEYTVAEMHAATKEIDELLGSWAQALFNVVAEWRKSGKYTNDISIDSYADNLASIQRKLRASEYA